MGNNCHLLSSWEFCFCSWGCNFNSWSCVFCCSALHRLFNSLWPLLFTYFDIFSFVSWEYNMWYQIWQRLYLLTQKQKANLESNTSQTRRRHVSLPRGYVIDLKRSTVRDYLRGVSGNTEAPGCKFDTDLWWWENKRLAVEEHLFTADHSHSFALTWFYFSQELSPSARKSLPWQDPQRLDSSFIWLWFTRPSDGGREGGMEDAGWNLPPLHSTSSGFTTNKQQTHGSTLSTGDYTFWEMYSTDMTDFK